MLQSIRRSIVLDYNFFFTKSFHLNDRDHAQISEDSFVIIFVSYINHAFLNLKGSVIT